MKDCGDCALCCKLIEVKPLGKPADTWCQHCTKHSCRIWSERPEICKTYDCLWRTTPEMPEELRPSQCKVAFECHDPEKVAIAHVDKDRPEAWRKKPVIGVITKLLREKWTVWVMIGQDRHLLLPEGKKPEDAMKAGRAAYNRVMHGSA